MVWAAAQAALKALAVGLLASALAVPVAVVATWGRGPLPAVAALLGVVVATQVLTTFGTGGWFPYAAPSLWAGLGGAAAAESITAVQLALVLPVAAGGVLWAARRWRRLEVR